jgi:hypothetical protein
MLLSMIRRLRSFLTYVNYCLLVVLLRNRFAKRDAAFHFDPHGAYSFENIYCGDHVSLSERPRLIATRSRIMIGNHVLFASEVVIRSGNHRIDMVGRFMDSVTEAENVLKMIVIASSETMSGLVIVRLYCME